MKKRFVSMCLALTLIFAISLQTAVYANATQSDNAEVSIQSQQTNDELKTRNALNALLIGVSVEQESEVSKWTDDAICDAIYGKLLWDEYQYSDSSFLSNLDLEYWTDEDWYWHFDLELIQKITRDTFGRDFPGNTYMEDIFVSGSELLIRQAIGESTSLSVQDFVRQGNRITAVGTAVHNNNGYSEFLGCFQAVFEENPSSVYGYTLLSLSHIDGNQDFGKLTASASSELIEPTITHPAGNVLDGDLKTAWVESVYGVGINEWIKLETTDGSKMDVSAIEFSMGYQKSDDLLQKNGWPNKVLIECEGGYRQEAKFYYYTDIVVLNQLVKTSWIKITILEASEGSKYDDTCISEIKLRGIDGTAYLNEYFKDNPNENYSGDNGIIIYSDYANLSVCKGSTITLSAGVLANGELTEDISGITLQIEDTSVLNVSTTDIKDNCRYVKLKGLAEGTTTVAFNDSNTGYVAIVPVTVYDDNYLSFTLNSVPTKSIEKYPTNVYNSNGLYIDSYKYTVNDDQSATVSFDVYNSNYTYGVVEVFNENGNMKDAVLIEKMTSSNTGIKEAIWDNIGYLVRDIIDGDLLSYRQESGYTKKTSVSVKIPPNGYIKICTDPENSLIVGLVNSVDGLMSMASLAGDIKDFDVNSKEFSKKLTTKLLTDQVYVELIKDGSDAPKDLWKNVGKETFITSESMGNYIDTITKNIDELKLGSIIADTAGDFGWNVGESVFTYFAGPAGTALKVMFTIGKVENLIIQQNDLIQSAGVGSICIQNQGGGIRSCQQIKVESKEELSSHTAQKFTVTLDATALDIIKKINPDIYETMTTGITYTYNISLLKNGNETQTHGKVTVFIPIPEDLKVLAYAGEVADKITGKVKIYRVEEDSSLTEMETEIENGCFVFTTSFEDRSENSKQFTSVTTYQDGEKSEVESYINKDWATAYIPVVEKALVKSGECVGGGRYGILSDMDGDAIPELLLSYPKMKEGSNWIWYYMFSVYDYENKSLIPIIEDDSIGASACASGGGGCTSIVYYLNTPMIIAYRTFGETSVGEGEYIRRDCEAFLYSFGSTAPSKTFAVKTNTHEVIFYSC